MRYFTRKFGESVFVADKARFVILGVKGEFVIFGVSDVDFDGETFEQMNQKIKTLFELENILKCD